MKNLIINKYLECEKELKININLSVEDVMFIKGKMEAYMNILQSLNQYNIITAPKQIKLSEIVSKLACYVKKDENGIWLYDLEDYEYPDINELFEDYSIIIKDNKITHIFLALCDEYKWLYTLWIAGTIIEDDTECEE